MLGKSSISTTLLLTLAYLIFPSCVFPDGIACPSKIRTWYGGTTLPKCTMPSDVHVFIHVHAQGHWWSILNEQLHALLWSGLYDRVTGVHVYLNLLHPNQTLGEARNLSSIYGAKIRVCIRVGDSTFERQTLQTIRQHVRPTSHFLYMHSKGVTHSRSNQPSRPGESTWNFFW